MKITKARLKTIILEEMQKIDEFLGFGKKPEGELSAQSPIIMDRYSDLGLEETGLGLKYDPNQLPGTDVGSIFDRPENQFGGPRADSVAHDLAARSGGTSRAADDLLASMDLSDFPEAADGTQVARGPRQKINIPSQVGTDAWSNVFGGQMSTPGTEYAGYQGPETNINPESAFQGLPVGATPEQIAWRAANPAGPGVMEPMRITASPPPQSFVGYGDYSYTPTADGGFTWSKGDKTGRIAAGSRAAKQVVSDRAEMGGRSQDRMAGVNENRKALRRAIYAELKRTGVI